MSVKGPPFFKLYQGNLQNRSCLKGPPLDIFDTVRPFTENFFTVLKGTPFEFFDIFQLNIC